MGKLGRPLPRGRGSEWRLVVCGGAVVLCVLLVGCDVGPKYAAPAIATPVPAFKESAPAAYSEAPPGTWRPAQPADAVLKGKWWEIFNEPELNALEEQLNINDQNIVQYFQNYMAARAQIGEARAGLFPTVGANPAYTKSRVGPTATSGKSSITSNYSLPFEVNWEPDLWGRIRNTIREYTFATQVSAADLENERLSEQASLAQYYFELRGQDSLQELYDRTVQLDKQSLELTQAQYENGLINQEPVVQARVTLETAEAAQTGVAVNRALYEHAIATLTGKAASEFSMPVKQLTTAVPAVPIGIPSQLLQRRPDIAAAERMLRQANAIIGVEKAAYYPTVSLTGSGGLGASAISKLFSVPALVWSLGASASQTLFDAGLRKATVAQYTATYNADVAAYKESILTAFQQVEDQLATLRVLSQQILKQEQAVKSSQEYVDLATSRYESGLDPYLDVMTAQLTLLSNRQALITERVNEMSAAVLLIKALGGGWDESQLPGK